MHRTESTAANTAATEHDDPFNKLIKDIFANELTAEQKKKPHPSRRKNAASSTSSCEKIWVMPESLSTYSSTAFLHYWSNLLAKINSKPTDDAEKWNSSNSCARVHICPSSETPTGNAFIKCPLQSNVSLKIMKQGNLQMETK